MQITLTVAVNVCNGELRLQSNTVVKAPHSRSSLHVSTHGKRHTSLVWKSSTDITPFTAKWRSVWPSRSFKFILLSVYTKRPVFLRSSHVIFAESIFINLVRMVHKYNAVIIFISNSSITTSTSSFGPGLVNFSLFTFSSRMQAANTANTYLNENAHNINTECTWIIKIA